jgi:hypothetical protein
MKKFTTTYTRPDATVLWAWHSASYPANYPADISNYMKTTYPDAVVSVTTDMSDTTLTVVTTLSDTSMLQNDDIIKNAVAFINTYSAENGITITNTEEDI